jgi:hypothetical protein
MKLSNVRTVLQFAFDLEAIASAFYETAITITTKQELKSSFEAFLLHGQGNIQTLMQLRQQMSSGLLKEDVSGIDCEHFRPQTECPPDCPDEQLIELASKMEKQLQDYYLLAYDQLGFINNNLNLLDRLAKNHAENMKALHVAV